jgi:putative oxidoreductase
VSAPAAGVALDGRRRTRALTILAELAAIALGIVFVAAAVSKIVDPPGFAHEVANYRLVPAGAVHALALFLPWLELFAGLALVTGIARRSAVLVTLVLLAVFLGALSINLARGRPVDCGCFTTKETPKTPEQRLSAMKLAILRDVGLVVLALTSLRASERSLRGRASAGREKLDSEGAA